MIASQDELVVQWWTVPVTVTRGWSLIMEMKIPTSLYCQYSERFYCVYLLDFSQLCIIKILSI